MFRDFGHQQIEQKHILHDPYMRMIKFTHVATTVPGSPEHSFLYTSFDRFHFVLLLSKELEPRMLSRYQTTDTMQPELYCPNLSRHQSSEAPLDLMLWTKESIFPKLLYDLGYEGAKETGDWLSERRFNMAISHIWNANCSWNYQCVR